MLINAQSLKEQVIEPTLQYLGEFNPSATYLLLGTAAVESQLSLLGSHDTEHNDQGIGLFGITPQQHTDIWDQYLAFDPELASQIRGLASQRSFLKNPHSELGTNLSYATAIAWCIYQRSSLPLGQDDNIQYLAACWSQHFRAGERSEDERKGHSANFCRCFKELITGVTLMSENSTETVFNAA